MLTSLIGWRGRAFVVPLTRRVILCNLGRHAADPVTASTPAYPRPGQLFIHELVHVWQFSHAPRLRHALATAIDEQLRYLRGDDVYRITGEPADWQALTMEQQATIVDRWFAGASSPTRTPMDPDSPQLRWIEQVRGAS